MRHRNNKTKRETINEKLNMSRLNRKEKVNIENFQSIHLLWVLSLHVLNCFFFSFFAVYTRLPGTRSHLLVSFSRVSLPFLFITLYFRRSSFSFFCNEAYELTRTLPSQLWFISIVRWWSFYELCYIFKAVNIISQLALLKRDFAIHVYRDFFPFLSYDSHATWCDVWWF